MITLTPRAHGIDISKYDQFFHPAEAVNQLDFVIQRASYGVTQDELYTSLLAGVLQVGIRGAYHYLSSGIPFQQQADKFLSIVGNHHHFYVCDFESAFNTMGTIFAKMAWDWIHYVAQKSGKVVLLYTSLSLYNDYIRPSQTIYGIDWNTVPLWQAQWLTFPTPNGNPTTPLSRTAGWDLFQYTNKGDGSKYGCALRTEFDLDVFNGTPAEMRARYGVSDTTPIPSHPFPNVDEYVEVVNGVKCHITLVTLDATTRFHVKHFNGNLGYVSQSKAQIAFSGQDYNKSQNPTAPFYPQGMAYVNGVEYTPQRDFQYWLNVSRDNIITADYHQISNYFNTTSFIRPLVVNGALHPSLYDTTKIENTEIHARSALGYTRTQLLQIVAEGHVNPSTGVSDSGVTLPQLAQLAIRYGAQFLGEHGGGGDAAKAINGVLVNVPSDPTERPVPQVLELFIGGNSMTRYTATAIADGTRLRPDHNIDQAYLASYNKGALFHGDNLYTVPTTTLTQNAGDQWLQVTDVNGIAAVGWVAITHKSLPICTLVDNGVTPPPADSITIDINLYDVKVTGDQYQVLGAKAAKVK